MDRTRYVNLKEERIWPNCDLRPQLGSVAFNVNIYVRLVNATAELSLLVSIKKYMFFKRVSLKKAKRCCLYG